jgi:hypothetical protein
MTSANALLENVIDYTYKEIAQRARTRQDHEDADITLRLLGLLRDGWSSGPQILDVACGYAVGLCHAKYLYKRDARAEFERRELLATIPDYDYSREPRIGRDLADGRRHFKNKFAWRGMDTDAIKEAAAKLGISKFAIYHRLRRGWPWERAISVTRISGRTDYANRLRHLAASAIAGDDTITISDSYADLAPADKRFGDLPTADGLHLVPSRAGAPSQSSLPDPSRRRPPKSIRSAAQMRHVAKAKAAMVYFGA